MPSKDLPRNEEAAKINKAAVVEMATNFNLDKEDDIEELLEDVPEELTSGGLL